MSKINYPNIKEAREQAKKHKGNLAIIGSYVYFDNEVEYETYCLVFYDEIGDDSMVYDLGWKNRCLFQK